MSKIYVQLTFYMRYDNDVNKNIINILKINRCEMNNVGKNFIRQASFEARVIDNFSWVGTNCIYFSMNNIV